jgi:threonine dehydrogenase-like Zn-dependent dehydrogenase
VAVITGPGEVELREEPSTAALGLDEVLVAVAACGICTMERRLFLGEKPMYPIAPGHEVSGHIVARGEAVAAIPGAPEVGDQVAIDFFVRCGVCAPCRRGRSAVCQHPQGGALSDGTLALGGGFADVLRVRASQVWPCGDAPRAHATMGEPLACVAHSFRAAGFQAGDRVVIVGGGYMGRLHLAVAQLLGAVSAGVVDVDPERRAAAATAGASWVAAPDALAECPSSDVVFVTAGAPGVLGAAVGLAAVGATVVLFGAFPKADRQAVAPDHLHHAELSLRGVCNHEPEDWRTATSWIRAGVLAADLDALVSASFALDAVRDALVLATTTPVYRVLVGG